MMAHDDCVGIIAHHGYGIFEGLTLCGTGGRGIRETDYPTAKPVYSCFETQAGTGRGFEEERGTYFAFEKPPIGVFIKFPCQIEYSENIFFGVICYGYKAFFTHIYNLSFLMNKLHFQSALRPAKKILVKENLSEDNIFKLSDSE